MKLFTLQWILLFLTISLSVPLKAQAEFDGFIVEATEVLRLYTVNDEGETSFVGELPPEFNLIRGNHWRILTISQMAISPDGQQLAFIAFQAIDQQSVALFVYSLNTGAVVETPIEGMGLLYWSPNGDAILVAPPPGTDSRFFPEIRDLYLYALDTQTLSNLTNTPDFYEANVQWLPDNQHIVFLGESVPCITGCSDTITNIWIIESDNPTPIVLTTLESDLPTDSTQPRYYCYPTNFTWSHQTSRLYYTARCGDAIRLDALFSVSLSQDNRLEADMPSLFPDDYYGSLTHILPSPPNNDVYITVDAQVLGRGDERNRSHWRVLRIGETQQVEIIHDETHIMSSPIVAAAISPNGQFLGLSGYERDETTHGQLSILNLSTDELIFHAETEAIPCALTWVNDERLLYNEFDDFCNSHSPEGVWLLDVVNQSIERVTENLDGLVWIIPN
jgi:hypothetical protein